MSFGLGVASSPSWNPDTNFAFLFSALRLVRLARDVNSVELSPLEWISVSITCQSWDQCSGASSQSEKQTAQYTMQKAKIQFIVIFSAILLRNGGQQSREIGRGADFEDFEETWEVRLHRHLLPLKRQQPCFALSCSWGRTHQLLEELGVRQRICQKKIPRL